MDIINQLIDIGQIPSQVLLAFAIYYLHKQIKKMEDNHIKQIEDLEKRYMTQIEKMYLDHKEQIQHIEERHHGVLRFLRTMSTRKMTL